MIDPKNGRNNTIIIQSTLLESVSLFFTISIIAKMGNSRSTKINRSIKICQIPIIASSVIFDFF